VRRWAIPLGRGGTVLIAIGLALLLVSLIPTYQTSTFMSSSYVYPKRWEAWHYDYVLTPQQSLHISVTANDTLSVYLLQVNTQTIYTWISDHYPDKIDFWNISYFEEFLDKNSESIHWQDEIQNGKIEYEYIPTKVTNTTLVLSNPSSNVVRIEYGGSLIASVAPIGKVRTLAQWAIPFGFLLSIPWLIDVLKSKKWRHVSAFSM